MREADAFFSDRTRLSIGGPRFIHLKRSDIRDVLLLRTPGETLSRAILPGARLSKKRSQSGKFSNAITPPPCVCLDKGIMRFYASHACFVDLQRCLCTQRHTSRLPASSSPVPPHPPFGKNSPPHAVGSFSEPPLTFLRRGAFFSFPSSFEKDLNIKCYGNQSALLSQKARIMVFLTLEISWERETLKISFLYIARRNNDRSILNLTDRQITVFNTLLSSLISECISQNNCYIIALFPKQLINTNNFYQFHAPCNTSEKIKVIDSIVIVPSSANLLSRRCAHCSSRERKAHQ